MVGICRGLSVYLLWVLEFEEAVQLTERALAAMDGEATVDRCRLLATAGISLGGACRYREGEQKFSEALAQARELGDDDLIGEICGYKAPFHWYYMEHQETIDAAERAADTHQRRRDLWQLCNAANFAHWG